MLLCECLSLGRRSLANWELFVCPQAVGMPPVSHNTNYPPGLGNAVKVTHLIQSSLLIYVCTANRSSLIVFIFIFFFTNYRLPLVATSVCSPAWSRLQSRAPRAATWASTLRVWVAIMQTPTWRGSVFSRSSWMLLAAGVAFQQPGHKGTSSGLL